MHRISTSDTRHSHRTNHEAGRAGRDPGHSPGHDPGHDAGHNAAHHAAHDPRDDPATQPTTTPSTTPATAPATAPPPPGHSPSHNAPSTTPSGRPLASRRNPGEADRRSIDDRIAALVATQHGVCTCAQLLEAGWTRRQVEARVTRGRLRRVHRGVYRLAHLHGSLEPAHLAEMAAVLAAGRGALVSHRSAGWLWGVSPRPPKGSVHVVVPSDRTPTRCPGVIAHRASDLLPGDATFVHGLPVTSPLRTLADLATVLGRRELERAVARAERERLVTAEELEALVPRRRGRPGGPALRAVILRDGGVAYTRSEAEARFLDLVRGSGLTPPEVNVVYRGRELDFLWRKEGVAVEVDGFRYHGSRRSFGADRRRDAELLGAGIRVMRVTWHQLVEEPKQVLVALTRALARSGRE